MSALAEVRGAFKLRFQVALVRPHRHASVSPDARPLYLGPILQFIGLSLGLLNPPATED